MKHVWLISFVVSSILAIFFPWLLVSSVGSLVIIALAARHREKELSEAIAKHEESVAYCKRMAEQFNERLKSLNELQGQVDNLKSSLSLNFGKRQ